MKQLWAKFNHDTFQLIDFDTLRLKRTALALREACNTLNPGDPRHPERRGYMGAWELWEGYKGYVQDAIDGRIMKPMSGHLPSSGYKRDFEMPEPFFGAYCEFVAALLGNPAWVTKDKERSLAFLNNPEQFMKQEDGQWYIWEEFEEDSDMS